MNEPSMEDILASIRRIIAADQTGVPLRGGIAAPAVEQPAEMPMLEAPPPSEPARPLGDAPASSAEHPARGGWGTTGADIRFPGMPKRHEMPPMPSVVDDAEPEAAEEQAHPDGPSSDRHGDYGLRDFETGAEIPDAEIYDLQESERVDVPPLGEPLISSAAGASISSSFQALAQSVMVNDPEMIERLTRDALRPMLKAWLDENLPGMVERLVRTEIERVARGVRSRD